MQEFKPKYPKKALISLKNRNDGGSASRPLMPPAAGCFVPRPQHYAMS